MKKHIILALVCLASFAKAATTVTTGGSACTQSSGTLYFCNISNPSDLSNSCADNSAPTTTSANPACAINTCGNGTADCTGGNNPWCGGGTKCGSVPDGASSLALLTGTMTLLGGVRRKFAARQ